MYKRVLVISHNSFSRLFNNGKTLESLFSNFPRENLSQLYFSKNEFPDFNFCSEYFKITDSDVLKSLFGRNKCGAAQVYNDKYNIHSTKSKFDYFSNLFTSYARKLGFFRDILWSFSSWKTDELNQWVKRQRPDLIFFLAGNLEFSHSISLYLSLTFKIPLYVYFTDDYVIYPYYTNLIEKIQRQRSIKFYSKTISYASKCFGINEYMSDSYSSFFSKPFYTILNSVDIVDWNDMTFDTESLVISYFGGLHLSRWKMIFRFGKCIKLAQPFIHRRIVMVVYTQSTVSKKLRKLLQDVNIQLKSPVIGSEYAKAISNSHYLLHVESDERYFRSLTMLSFSTKLSEYLISGRPVLAFGPLEVSSFRYLIDYDLGIVISSDLSENELVKKLKDSLANLNEVKARTFHAYNFAKENFSRDVVNRRFEKLIDF